MAEDKGTAPADIWGAGGTAYERISFGLGDGIVQAVQALWPRPGEAVLDLGCGTGWAARMMAGMGARVTAADPSPAMLDAARRLARRDAPGMDFLCAGAEGLPLDDAAFDAVLSTYGAMFSPDPGRAAAEIARVLRPGGRLVLLTWAAAPGGYIDRFFGLIGRHAAEPAPGAPMAWGDPDWLADRFGAAFRLHVRPLTTVLYAPDAESVWEKYLAGFGPLRAVWASLDADGRAAMRAEFLALHDGFADGPGLRIARAALMARGTRR